MYIVKSGSLPISPGPAPAAAHCEALGSDPTHSNPGQWFLDEAVSPSSKGSLGGPGLPMRFPLGAFGGLRKKPATLLSAFHGQWTSAVAPKELRLPPAPAGATLHPTETPSPPPSVPAALGRCSCTLPSLTSSPYP